jgi:hypothetical protein
MLGVKPNLNVIQTDENEPERSLTSILKTSFKLHYLGRGCPIATVVMTL